MVELRWRCKTEGCDGLLRHEAGAAGPLRATCSLCKKEAAITIDEPLARDGDVQVCPCCAGREFFVRKDFPQRLGLLIVIVAALASCVLYYRNLLLWTWGVLAGAVVLDALLMLVTGRVTVCYRCRAELRGVKYNPDHEGFDLATSEKYG